jgi:hypothetical protein
MIERVVLIRLDAAYREDLGQVVDASRQVLAEIPGVRALRVGIPADERTARDWDVCIQVRFDDMDAVEAYRAHERHRKYVDVFLRPMLERIRAFNFEVDTR